MIKSYFLTLLTILSLTFNANAAFDVNARTAILQDYLSGEILYEKDADKSIYPASMTKIMTAIVVFDLIENGDLALNEKFIVSENAWRLSSAGYSSMFIMIGDEVTVEDLLKGIIRCINCFILFKQYQVYWFLIIMRTKKYFLCLRLL